MFDANHLLACFMISVLLLNVSNGFLASPGKSVQGKLALILFQLHGVLSIYSSNFYKSKITVCNINQMIL